MLNGCQFYSIILNGAKSITLCARTTCFAPRLWRCWSIDRLDWHKWYNHQLIATFLCVEEGLRVTPDCHFVRAPWGMDNGTPGLLETCAQLLCNYVIYTDDNDGADRCVLNTTIEHRYKRYKSNSIWFSYFGQLHYRYTTAILPNRSGRYQGTTSTTWLNFYTLCNSQLKNAWPISPTTLRW